MMRKGISPIIATVILVAVALIIAVAIVGWLFGLWGGLAGGAPAIQITNLEFTSDNTAGRLEIYVRNIGGGADKILKIEITNGTETETVSEVTYDGKATSVIPANFAGWVTASFTKFKNTPQGTVLTVKIYFEKSGTQIFTVTAS